MSVRAMSWAYAQKVGNPGRKLVLVTLADHADDQGLCWPSVPRIAEFSEVSERTVRDHLAALENAGLIVREESWRQDGGRSVNRYRLRLDTPSEVSAGPGDPPLRNLQGGGAKSAGAPLQFPQGPPAKSAGAGEPPTGVPLEPSVEPSVEAPPPARGESPIGGEESVGEMDDYFGVDHAEAARLLRALPGWSPVEERTFRARWTRGPTAEFLFAGVPPPMQPAVLAEAVYQYVERREGEPPRTWSGARFSGWLRGAARRVRAAVEERQGEARSPGDRARAIKERLGLVRSS